MVENRQATFLSQLSVTFHILFRQRVFKTARDWILRDLFQKVEDMIDCASHGQIVMNPKSLGCHRLHGFHLVHYVLERRQMILHPSVTSGGEFLNCGGHPFGMSRDSPGSGG